MTSTATATGPRAADNRVGFGVRAVPKFMRPRFRESYSEGKKKLKRVDGDLLELLLSLRYARRDSCWCTKAFAAADGGDAADHPVIAVSSVHGFIDQVPVATHLGTSPGPTPGWRIVVPGGPFRPAESRREGPTGRPRRSDAS